MKKFLSSRAWALCVLFSSVALSLPAQASVTTFFASLSGAAESPANNSLGSGSTTVTIDDVLHTMFIHVDFTGLTGTTTAAHVHCCTAVPGVGNIGVATELPLFTGFPTGVTSGTYDHTFDTSLASTWSPAFVAANGGTALGAESAFISGLRAGRGYLNVHSTFRPGGEIRGFLQVPEPSTASMLVLSLLMLGTANARRARQGR